MLWSVDFMEIYSLVAFRLMVFTHTHKGGCKYDLTSIGVQ